MTCRLAGGIRDEGRIMNGPDPAAFVFGGFVAILGAELFAWMAWATAWGRRRRLWATVLAVGPIAIASAVSVRYWIELATWRR